MSGYGMGGYVGSTEDSARIRRQQKEREDQRKQFEDAKRKIENGAAGLRQFGTGTSEMLEHAFKTETVGLVTKEEFVEKRQTIADRMHAEAKRQREAHEEEDWVRKQQEKAKKAKAEQRHKLSFDDDFDNEDDEEEEEEKQEDKADTNPLAAIAAATAAKSNPSDTTNQDKQNQQPARRKFATLGKDPTVNAAFLPDKDRDHEEAELREKLKAEYALQQAAIKAEPLDITYSYWNGTGHRRNLTVRKGDTIGAFLKAVQEQLASQFREMRVTNVSNLMYIKEDIILPQTVSFYDLIVNKAMGKSGPLFQFDLQEHAAAVYDPRLKSQDSHAGKVVERHWYNRNRHIFPYSNWDPYDPEKHNKQ